MRKTSAHDVERSARIKGALVLWAWFVIVTTVIVLFIYVVAQQELRMSANDPQVQIAEDDAADAASSSDPQISAPSPMVDMTKSLDPFVIFFDADGIPTASSAQLGGMTPVIPQGVFEYARANDEDRFTWEPQNGVRIAAVVVKIGNGAVGQGFVLAGRSLREVENREAQVGLITLSTYGCLLILETILLALTILVL